MKFLYDFFPIILFFITYKVFSDPDDLQRGILAATAVAIVASVVQVGFSWLKHRKVEKMHVITMLMIVVLGSLTLIFKDEMFIKWKPSVVNWLFGVVFLGSQFFGEKNIIQRMMEDNIELPAPVWVKLNLMWGLFFISMGLVNLYVVYNYDTDTWVNFKLFGMLGLTFAFVIIQALYLSRHIKQDEEVTAEKQNTEDQNTGI